MNVLLKDQQNLDKNIYIIWMEFLNTTAYSMCTAVYQHVYVQAQMSHDNSIFTELRHFVIAQYFNWKSILDKSVNNAIIVG